MARREATGPMSGQRAALFLLIVGVRVEVPDSDPEGHSRPREVFEERARMIVGESVLVRTGHGTVLVPVEGLQLIVPHAEGATVAVDSPLPAEIADALDPSEDRVLFYRELALSRGDRVRLEATVCPRGGSGESGAEWVARPDLGHVTLVDRSQDDGDVARMTGMSSQRAAALIGLVACALGAAYFWLVRAPEKGPPPAETRPPAEARPPTLLRDTDGRSFEDTCSPDPFCTLTQTGGPVDPRRPRIVLRRTDYLVSVCTAEVRYGSNGASNSWVEEGNCRPLECNARSECPAGKDVECVNGLCVQSGKDVGLFDVHPLCLAGKGLEAQNPDVDAASHATPCHPAECRFPPSCRHP